MAMPKVRFGEPEVKDSFNLYNIDCIDIYISKWLVPKEDKIHLQFSSFLGIFKSIEVFGFKM